MFELPFKKSTIAGWVMFCILGGSGTVLAAVHHQNVKHGFVKK
jgi:hypothetical protein